MMHHNHTETSVHQKGFSLIELLVGLLIGLLATIVIVQTFSVFEGRKRTTSGNADAQTNGNIALTNIQRSIQMAGYGIPLPSADKDNNPLKCNAFADFDPDNNAATNNSTNLFPIVIQDDPANASDTITVRYSTSAAGAIPVGIVNAANATGAAGLVADNNIGCHDKDIALISNGTTCIMTTVDDANGNPDTNVNIRLNALTPVGNPLVNGAKIACMGNWQNYTYQIVNNELRLNNQPIISEVVNMQAQYGVSSAADNNQVNQWVDATGGTWAAPTVANRNRIKAIRIALVLRNGLREREDVTAQCTTANGVVNQGPCAWDDTGYSNAPVIDLSADPNWKKYRYRVFETIIPLRNMLWSKDSLK